MCRIAKHMRWLVNISLQIVFLNEFMLVFVFLLGTAAVNGVFEPLPNADPDIARFQGWLPTRPSEIQTLASSTSP